MCHDFRLFSGDLSGYGQPFCISISDFERDILHNLTSHDCVILLHASSSLPTDSYNQENAKMIAVTEK